MTMNSINMQYMKKTYSCENTAEHVDFLFWAGWGNEKLISLLLTSSHVHNSIAAKNSFFSNLFSKKSPNLLKSCLNQLKYLIFSNLGDTLNPLYCLFVFV